MIDVDQLTKVFPGGVRAVDGLSFRLEAGQTLALIGPSGCGKTTTLKLLNRLYEPTSGSITLDGDNLLTHDPVLLRRRIGYVMQAGGLFPHWTVERNIGTVPELLDWPVERTRRRTEELLELVGLPANEYRRRYPLELSGGQRQRIGIARALAADPPLILLDEPFSALDAVTRRQMQREFLHLKQVVGKTMIIVTHDLAEAFLLADQVLLLNRGRLEQFGPPAEFRERPASEFVKGFVAAELE